MADSPAPPPDSNPAPPAPPAPAKPRRRTWREFLALVAPALLSRGYALALIVVITYLTWQSIAYLVTALVTPARAPLKVRAIPTRLDAQLLQGHRRDWLGLAAVEGPRAPLGHYHRMDAWIAPDPFNNCTQSGCHGPLPHARNTATRAFLNMHATSLHCGVCHMTEDRAPLPLVWYSATDGKPGPAPAVLRAAGWLAQRKSPERRAACDAASRDEIVELLRSAAQGADGDPMLLRIADHLAAARPGREEFARLLDTAEDAVVRSFRGSYGRKLALAAADNAPVLAHPGTAAAVAAFLKSPPAADAPDRAQRLAELHPRKRDVPRDCLACHAPGNSLIDFARLGYPQQRIDALRGGAIFPMIERLGTGEPFEYPAVLSPGR